MLFSPAKPFDKLTQVHQKLIAACSDSLFACGASTMFKLSDPWLRCYMLGVVYLIAFLHSSMGSISCELDTQPSRAFYSCERLLASRLRLGLCMMPSMLRRLLLQFMCSAIWWRETQLSATCKNLAFTMMACTTSLAYARNSSASKIVYKLIARTSQRCPTNK